MRRSLACDQAREMARHKALSSRVKMPVYFCDPHSPWQRPSNDNLNGLIRRQLPKGVDLIICSQRELDIIAHGLNTTPRAVLGFQAPEDGFVAELSKLGGALQM